MQVRQLDMTQVPEALAATQVTATAFRSPERYRQLVAETRAAPDRPLPDPAAYDPARRIWGAFAGDTLAAVVTGISYHILFEGQVVPMCGIGGVATLPEYRRQGAIRAIMERLLRQVREEGTVFSYLYPFSFQFYAKFGYGPGCRRHRVELPADFLRTLPGSGQIRHYRPEDRAVVESIYARFTAGSNGPVRRTPWLWDRLLGQDRWQEQQHVYIWQPADGPEAAYAVFKTVAEGGKDTLRVQDWAVTGPAGLTGLLSFLGGFADQYATVILQVPTHLDLTHYFAEPRPLKHQLEIAGQSRVVHAAMALSGLGRPDWLIREARWLAAETGSPTHMTWQIEDDFLPENSGLYRLDLATAGQPAERLETPGPAADITVRNGILAPLLLGAQGLDELAGHPDVKIRPDMDEQRLGLLCRFLSRKKNGIYDSF
ncbi:MAG: GNAT family N-acetyltransferase [Clostridiaceae bacterium]|jgi:predicted acetyltransferase|nr:GNAT family N-acetyltransferase [Clostridiaceae bacterium]